MNIQMKTLIEKTKKLKILYVEDNEETRQQALKIFTNFFDHIDVAIDGVSALEKFKENVTGYDIVISDIIMPRMNGFEMSQAILELKHNQNILILSAYNDSEQLQRLMDIGLHNYIHKPVNLQVLITELQKIILIIEREAKQEEELIKIKNLNHELDALIKSFNTYVIASRTDLKGVITYVSKAYEIISGYKDTQLLGKPHNIVRHPDMPASAFKDMWETIKSGKLWVGEVKNLRSDGSYYWVTANVAPYYDKNEVHIGYSSIRIDITAQKEVERLHNDVNNLLNNAGQGFLSFNENMKINSSFSKECLNIFECTEIVNENIADMLFSNDTTKRELFIEGVQRALQTDEDMIKDMFLSLLPKEHTLKNKNINIEYKLLNNNHFMLIITDVTTTKLLEQKLQEQNQIQKMIVAVASDQNDFIELKFDFENFIKNPSSDLRVLLRELHTFKGIFAQKEMLNIANGIHELESIINSNLAQKNIVGLVHKHDLQNIFNKDLEIIASTLGEDFLSATSKISIDTQTLDTLESKIKALKSNDSQERLSDILHDFEVIKYESVYEMLHMYQTAVKQMAQKLEKEIYPLEIIGDKNLVVSSKIKPFIKSLIHLFNNCVDHGIEDMETRIENEKDEMGKITCQFFKNEDGLQIRISDDGGGINIEKLRASAKNKGITVNGDQSMLVFADNLSTKEQLSSTSGRGVGMSAIKSEVTKLGGNIEINNNIGVGVEFIFTLPL